MTTRLKLSDQYFKAAIIKTIQWTKNLLETIEKIESQEADNIKKNQIKWRTEQNKK